MLSGEKDVTASAIIPLLEHLKVTTKPVGERSLIVNELNEKLIYYILPRFAINQLSVIVYIF